MRSLRSAAGAAPPVEACAGRKRENPKAEGRFYLVVLIRFHEPPAPEFFCQLDDLVRRIKAAVPGLPHYYFGPNASDRGKGYTHVNLSVFDPSADHDAYQAHPLHHEIRALMAPRMEFVVCDYDAAAPG